MQHLKDLISHEYNEARYLNLRPELMDKFLDKHDLYEDLLKELAEKGVDIKAVKMQESNIRPVTPYRYAHLIVEYTIAKQPKSRIIEDYEEMGLVKLDYDLGQYVLTAKGRSYMGLK
ncbi:hypothetical protein [Deinococcus multiflagellatus]|uniref:Uncharacterized protein n=1 Tax=Deinococcus multiflagellatus TaxID=1656887 RepID=A0ABW1ZI21_9DEIO|nr:hypothetical protein [Deinococcus multiflagellatus]MBZ9713188.1 hypothetical protein [Deinococcus multiflagellatus]